ncbi:MAG TPA: ATP-binding protein [Solirubrobacteraceae bacterium]|nr:ATP-binding protein [Solirubrobacteraceae bacterium]
MRPIYNGSSMAKSEFALSYTAEASSIRQARSALRAFADTQGATREKQDDIALSCSEALTNVVEHAYTEPGGEIHVCASRDGEQMLVVIADDGCGPGFPKRVGLRLGMPVMSAYSDQLTLSRRPGGGFEVRLLFALC